MAQDQGGPNVEGIKLTILKSGGGGVKMNKLSALHSRGFQGLLSISVLLSQEYTLPDFVPVAGAGQGTNTLL